MTTIGDPPPPLPACESYSSLATYEACPRRYAFKYVERVPGEVSPGQFAFGNAVHKAFEVFVRERIRARTQDGGADDVAGAAVGAPGAAAEASPEAVLETLRRACDWVLERAGLDTAELDTRRAPGPSPSWCAFSSARRPTYRPPWRPSSASASTSLCRAKPSAFGSSATSTARPRARRLDRGARLQDRSRPLAGRRRRRPSTDRLAYACARGALRDPATGEPLPPAARLALYFADSGLEVATSRTGDQLATFEADLVAMVTAVRSRAFGARPSAGRCRWCEYRGICPEAALPA